MRNKISYFRHTTSLGSLSKDETIKTDNEESQRKQRKKQQRKNNIIKALKKRKKMMRRNTKEVGSLFDFMRVNRFSRKRSLQFSDVVETILNVRKKSKRGRVKYEVLTEQTKSNINLLTI